MATKKPKTQDYIVTLGNTIATDTERWGPGSRIALEDDKARIYLDLGTVIPLDNTIPPEPLPPPVIEHVSEVELPVGTPLIKEGSK